MKTRLSKIFWLLFAGIGAPLAYFFLPGKHEWMHAAAVISVGLAMAFFGREPVNDEHVHHLKMKALKATFVPALALTLILNMAVLNPAEPDVVSHSLSAFDFAGLTMFGSLSLFHYWFWQDGSEQPAAQHR